MLNFKHSKPVHTSCLKIFISSKFSVPPQVSEYLSTLARRGIRSKSNTSPGEASWQCALACALIKLDAEYWALFLMHSNEAAQTEILSYLNSRLRKDEVVQTPLFESLEAIAFSASSERSNVITAIGILSRLPFKQSEHSTKEAIESRVFSEKASSISEALWPLYARMISHVSWSQPCHAYKLNSGVCAGQRNIPQAVLGYYTQRSGPRCKTELFQNSASRLD